MNIHLKRKPYECSICNFKFNANPNLIRHKKNVHNIKFTSSSTPSSFNSHSPPVVLNTTSFSESIPPQNNNEDLDNKKDSISSTTSVSLAEISSNVTKQHISTLKPEKLSNNISVAQEIYKPNNYNILKERKLPEPIYNFQTAHPVKFSDLVIYETVINLVDSKSKLNLTPQF
ncbi:hypothetical protein QEN19_003100 [Hanseniaspora menglaensis]